jgi:hypothetical protein
MKLEHILSFIFGTGLGYLVLQTILLGFLTGVFGVIGSITVNYILKQTKLKRDNAKLNRCNDMKNRENDVLNRDNDEAERNKL